MQPHLPFLTTPGTWLRLTFHIMNASMLFALELHKARHDDLLRQVQEDRLRRAAPARRRPLPAVLARVAMHLAAVLHGMEGVAQLPPHY